MKNKHIFALAGIVAGLVAGCGAGSGDSGAEASATLASVTVSGGGAATSTSAPARWASVKWGGGGYVPGLVFHPTSPDVLYARTDIGGAYRWNAANSSWIPITDGFHVSEGFHHGTESIALDPNDDRLVYMSTGLYHSENPTGRLYISADRGDTWEHVNLPFSVGSNNQGRAIGERLMVDPNQPSILFYGSRTSGLWKSEDRGRNWSQVTSLSSVKMTQAQIDASEWRTAMGVEQVVFDTSTKGSGAPTQTIYTAVAPDYAGAAGLTHSLYKSVDGGATWTGVPTPVTGYHIPHMVRAKDGIFYIAFTKGSGPGANGPGGLYKFDGSNWTLLKSFEPTQWTSFGLGGVSVYGSGPTTRIALGVTNSWGNWEGQPVVALSDDAGATWREIAAMAPHTPNNVDFSGWVDDVEIDPNNPERVLHVFGGGVWETRNASAAKPSWNLSVEGLEETAVLSLMTPPPGANYRLLNSSGDIGMWVQSELYKKPTRGVGHRFGNGISADMAWSTPSYIAAVGTPVWNTPTMGGMYSTDSGVTWNAFASNHPDALNNLGNESNIAVTKPGHIVWAPANSVPAYTTNHGATWTYTNLPPLASIGLGRSYRVVADRKNPNKVYAFNSGGAWWAQWTEKPRFFASVDGGKTFTESMTFQNTGAVVADYNNSSMVVNPYVEGEVWVADGQSLLHSRDGGATWTKLNVTAPIWGQNPTWMYPEVYGATSIALGKAPAGAKYSASIYIVGTIDSVWGVYRSDDGGATWRRINDDKHQYGGIGNLAADHTVPGRLFMSGSGRGVLFSY